MSTKPRAGEIIVERFVVAYAKNGAGYIEELAGKPGEDLRVRRFTGELADARRFPGSVAAAREFLGELGREFELIACTAEIRIGPKPKPNPAPAQQPARRRRGASSSQSETEKVEA